VALGAAIAISTAALVHRVNDHLAERRARAGTDP
jgi:hypothetical protein